MIKPDLSYENGPEKLKAAAPAYTKVFKIAFHNSNFLCFVNSKVVVVY